MLNKVILMGRLVKDPELKYTPSNVAVVSFTVAVDRRYQKQDEKQADFINVVAWRSAAEFVSKWFRKGQMIALSGSIQTRTWDDSDGNRRYVTEVIAEEVSFAGSKGDTQAPVQEQNSESDFIDVTPAVGEDGLPF